MVGPQGRGKASRDAPAAWVRALANALVAVGIGLSCSACYSVAAGRQAIDRVDVVETAAVPSSEVEDRIATGPSPRFLGIWDGVVFDYQYYDKFVLARDLARIERLYHARGYYDARVTAARVIPKSDGHVRVEIAVDEGQAYNVTERRHTGLEKVPFELQGAVLDAMDRGLRVGDRFDEDRYEATKSAIQNVLMNGGFAWARVSGKVTVDVVSRRVMVAYDFDPGERFKIRSVRVEGLASEVPEARVRRALGFREGDTFSAEKLAAGQEALLELGVFADVNIQWENRPKERATAPASSNPCDAAGERATPQPGRPDRCKCVLNPCNAAGEPAIDVVVKTSPAPLRAVKLGGGVELDVIRTDLHAVAGWEDRNFLGGLRHLALTIRPGVVLFPTTVPEFKQPTRYLPEVKTTAEFRQPGFLEPRAGGILRGNVSIYPVIIQPQSEDVILGYRELRGAAGLDRPFWGGRLYLLSLLHGQAYYPFTYHGPQDSALRTVFIRYLELETQIAFRDNAVQPTRGVFVANNLQLAGGVLGGSVDDVKVQPDVRFYVPISRKVVFAVRGSVGFLFPRNYGESLDSLDITDKALYTRDQQLVYFRAFFSGGPNSNRGYPYGSVGPHGPGGFLIPGSGAVALQQACNPSHPSYSEDRCLIPLGGLSLWESSAEIRVQLLGELSGVVFADASDVTRRRTTLQLDYPHLSTGFGLRYRTPVGPIRGDIGYRVPGAQRIGGPLPASEGDPGTIFGAPIAFSIAVGEAF